MEKTCTVDTALQAEIVQKVWSSRHADGTGLPRAKEQARVNIVPFCRFVLQLLVLRNTAITGTYQITGWRGGDIGGLTHQSPRDSLPTRYFFA